MTHLIRRDAVVRADLSTATQVLRDFVAQGGAVVVRPTCRLPALNTEIMLARDVVIELAPAGDGWHVRWSPSDGTAFPRLTGRLTLDADGLGTILRLEAEYDGPTTTLSDTRDAQIGVRLVLATAAAMLANLTEILAEV